MSRKTKEPQQQELFDIDAESKKYYPKHDFSDSYSHAIPVYRRAMSTRIKVSFYESCSIRVTISFCPVN